MRAGLISVIVLVPMLVACATTPTGGTRYERDLEKLEADCRERGGILATTGGQTGRAQTDFVCRITGASRLN